MEKTSKLKKALYLFFGEPKMRSKVNKSRSKSLHPLQQLCEAVLRHRNALSYYNVIMLTQNDSAKMLRFSGYYHVHHLRLAC